jgi:hypothetical protein
MKNLPKRTRENIAACAAHGLYFWSDHPAPATLWATSDDQKWHTIRIHRATGQSSHSCWFGFGGVTATGCSGGKSLPYSAPANLADAAAMLGAHDNNDGQDIAA